MEFLTHVKPKEIYEDFLDFYFILSEYSFNLLIETWYLFMYDESFETH